MNDNQIKSIDDDLKAVKSVETEAGRVEYISPTDAIKLNEYRRRINKDQRGGVLSRVAFIRTRPAGNNER